MARLSTPRPSVAPESSFVACTCSSICSESSAPFKGGWVTLSSIPWTSGERISFARSLIRDEDAVYQRQRLGTCLVGDYFEGWVSEVYPALRVDVKQPAFGDRAVFGDKSAGTRHHAWVSVVGASGSQVVSCRLASAVVKVRSQFRFSSSRCFPRS